MTKIRLHNTLSRTKEDFVPLDPQNVRMYVCGPTVYDRAHLGNARPVVVFDVLFRLLRHVYGEGAVKYARNFTDVDDRINETAQKRRAAGAEGSLEALIHQRTEETIAWYHADMDALGNLRPTFEPRATEYIGEERDNGQWTHMIGMIQALIEGGFAYSVREPSNNPPKEFVIAAREAMLSETALFEVRKFDQYGKFSGRSLDDMIAGARVEEAPYKRDPLDFVLWKPSDASLPGWPSPWGRGRPGWHIECSAMSKALLGTTFDIHGGGLDLQFPHHENEIAQSCCANHTKFMARYWMHNEMLLVEGKKMSKSLGNFFTVRDLLDQGVPGEVIRYVMLMTHYRSPMDWTAEKREQGERALRRWRKLFDGVAPTTIYPEVAEALKDDLNTAGALNFLAHLGQVLFQKAGSKWQVPEAEIRDANWDRLAGQFVASAQLMGLLEPDMGNWTKAPDLHPLARRLQELRETALSTKNFAPVDALKSALIAAGVEVRMSKAGVELVPGPGFDPAKLEGL